MKIKVRTIYTKDEAVLTKKISDIEDYQVVAITQNGYYYTIFYKTEDPQRKREEEIKSQLEEILGVRYDEEESLPHRDSEEAMGMMDSDDD